MVKGYGGVLGGSARGRGGARLPTVLPGSGSFVALLEQLSNNNLNEQPKSTQSAANSSFSPTRRTTEVVPNEDGNNEADWLNDSTALPQVTVTQPRARPLMSGNGNGKVKRGEDDAGGRLYLGWDWCSKQRFWC